MDLISRQVSEGQLLKNYHFVQLTELTDECIERIADAVVKKMPTAEKQGKWKHRKNWSMYVCDQCSFESREASRYCPHCGARMEE